VWHDTRQSAVTHLVAAGVPEVVAMSVSGHADPNVFKRYNCVDDVQADAIERQQAYLASGERRPASSPQCPAH
jgi:hypothetical protein